MISAFDCWWRGVAAPLAVRFNISKSASTLATIALGALYIILFWPEGQGTSLINIGTDLDSQ